VFLELEQSGVPMHIGAALIFDGSSLRDAHGAFDVRSVRSVLASRLHLAEKTRWRVEPVPLSGRYVWVDDDCFRLDYHFRHVALPPPGARAQLDAVSTDFFTRGLDLTRPLWEILVVDGLEDGRVAALCKFHHAMMDGLAGVELLNLLLRLEPSRQSETPYLWRARRQPGLRELVEGETRRRIGLARGAAQALLGSLRNPGASLDATRSHALGIAHTVRAMASPSTRLAFNEALGPSRAVEHFRIALGDVKKVRQRFGGTINEFVLALVAGGLRRYLQAQDWDVETLQARALIPVSTRSDLERGEFGNKIAVVVAELPVAEPDPVGRLEAACRASARTKQSRQALGTEVVTRLAEWTRPALLTQALLLSMRLRAANLMVTNIRGPEAPLYILDAPLLEIYPVAELWPGQGLNVAVFSYAGFLHFGINADPDVVEDADQFCAALRSELAELTKLAS
jgi:WS/DGAT/MGAT family acyltransferase